MPRKAKQAPKNGGRSKSPRGGASTVKTEKASSRPVTPRPGTPNPDGTAAPSKKEPYVPPKQRDMLIEAIETEAVNRRWLEIRKREALEKTENTERALARTRSKHPRRISQRTGTVVTFPSVEVMPPFMVTQLPEPSVPNTTCAITGEPNAKYRCPRTGLPYANAAAFKELRRRHGLGDGPLRTNTLADVEPFLDPRTELDLPVKAPVVDDNPDMDWSCGL